MVDNRDVSTSANEARRSAPSRRPRPDAALLAAADVARDALLEAVDAVDAGAHLGAETEGERLVTHVFDCLRAGYRGWRWSVVLTRAPRQKAVTVDEIVLLPGPDAIVAPAWVPYRDRVQPADLGPGDLILPEDGDPRLAPAWFVGDEFTDGLIDENAVRQVADEVGLGRVRVLSLEGRDEAAQRWFDSDQGPESPLAQAAPGRCRDCGFLVRLGGPLATVFGVCANGRVPDDGRVVALDHGCGGHSETILKASQQSPTMPPHVFDTVARDDIEIF
jgi:hypothetical protein